MKVFTVQDLAVRENLEIKVNWEETLRPLQKEIGVGFGTLKNLSNNKTRNTLNQKPRTRRNLVTWLQEKGYKIHLQV